MGNMRLKYDNIDGDRPSGGRRKIRWNKAKAVLVLTDSSVLLLQRRK